MIRHSDTRQNIRSFVSPRIGNQNPVLTWNVHTPEGNRLQSVGSHSVTGVEEGLNRATEILTSGVDFAVGLPYEVVGELQGFVRDFRTISDALRILAGGLETLLKDFNRGLETVGILERSLLQEGYTCGMNQYTRARQEAERTTAVCSCSRPTNNEQSSVHNKGR